MRKMHLLSMTRLPRGSRGGRVAIEKCKLDTKRERHTMRWQQCSLTGTTRSRMTCTYEVLARFLTSFSESSLREYILSSGSQNGSGSSIVEEDDPLLNEASLALDNHPLADLTDDSLGLNDTLGLEHDFTSELLGGSLLESAGVEGLLSNDTLGLPDEFNLEEALQLVGLDEAQPEETKSEVKKKKEDTAEDSASAEGDAAITASSNAEVVKSSSRCEDPETGDMIHTPQFHHPHHPHHRSFQICAVAVLRDAERAADVVENGHGGAMIPHGIQSVIYEVGNKRWKDKNGAQSRTVRAAFTVHKRDTLYLQR
ncbi:hypothetical protein ALC57_14564 [Trachymyrmex cornetzi]|uniref:Uncharacterized protein n=1 Tax=Trachymyrmex cornetzi TaxID=471704 RepID=A0A151IYB6_9HYME|nr:hypothetical protein ALC57_14564 [Trachymyrmex cornetzi]